MSSFDKTILFAASAISGLAVLLLIISVATPAWLDDGQGNTIGLFRKCVAKDAVSGSLGPGCHSENRSTQGGLSIFGLLLLIFSLFATIAAAFTRNQVALLASFGLLYFASLFIMSAYASWAGYSRDLASYTFPIVPVNMTSTHTSIGYSYNLCVASHFFIWTSLTLVAFAVGFYMAKERNA
jgi:hypothetical protein